ncbi:hypothetical protein [Noviherbaspirillum pedocola]|uniref:Uncharacterized protein n=1 Tax=Noviherbaspirillum pedocola TaxID=2801341 RepID=A0A934T194_9BURK|nr:hypothetical protein [Noviherbaspirillum pedocola]MBK4736799.1 hypothetical protein [Noviherbaspirillum pedocola]
MNKKVMRPQDYTLGAARDYKRLLYEDTEKPRDDLETRSDIALAELAATVHKNAPGLISSDFELVIGWLKTWKLHDRTFKRSSPGTKHVDFYNRLEELKNSGEQKDLQKRAYRKTLWSRLWAMLFGVSLAVTCILFFSSDVAWYWKTASLIVTVFLFIFSDILLENGIKLYKEQDRRYILASIREAESVVELSDAGLFGYLPGTSTSDKSYSEAEAVERMRKERDKLTDALYRDSGEYLSMDWRNH